MALLFLLAPLLAPGFCAKAGAQTPPAAPTNLNAREVGGEPYSVRLLWDASSGATSYTVFNAAYNTPIVSTTGLTVVINSLEPNKTYFFVVRAYNQSVASPPSNQEIWTTPEGTPPVVTISTPANSSGIKSLNNVAGNASDEAGGSGLRNVVVRILCTGPTTSPLYNLWWNGNGTGLGWKTTRPATSFATTLNADGSWRFNDGRGLPAGADLPDGNYSIGAYAYDNAGNQGVAVSAIVVDHVAPPAVTVQKPTGTLQARGFYNTLTAGIGTAQDNTGGSGIAGVLAHLYREGYISTVTPGYWNSALNNWQDAPYNLLASGTTSWSVPFPALDEGYYRFRPWATDRAGNTSTSQNAPIYYFGIDKTNPTISAAQPTSSQASGTASDVVSRGLASGIKEIRVQLYRETFGSNQWGYWNGTAWVQSSVELLAQGANSWTFAFPSLATGRYRFQARAIDFAGNSSAWSTLRYFTVDATVPTVAITSPTGTLEAPTPYQNLTAASGKAGDDVGVSQVRVQLIREANGTNPEVYWDGVNFMNNPALEVRADGTTDWSVVIPYLAEGKYRFRAKAIDTVGNVSAWSDFRYFLIDRTIPTVTVETPTGDDTYNRRVYTSRLELAQARGTATDERSGLSRVEAQLFREKPDGTPESYWDGSQWVTPETTLTASGTSSWTVAFPTHVYPSLRNGKYQFKARAIDRAGNVSGWTTKYFQLAIPNGVPVANSDSYVVGKNLTLTINDPGVLANDSEPDNDGLGAEKVSDPAHGTLVLEATGAFTYTPNVGFLGSDTFTYRAFDESDVSAPATVRITVAEPIGAPSTLQAVSTGSGKITLYWDAVAGAVGYKIYRSITSGGQNYASPINGSDNGAPSYPGSPLLMLTDTGRGNGTEYFYTVKAVAATGVLSAPSNEASDIVDPEAIPWDTRDPGIILGMAASIAQDEAPDEDFDVESDFTIMGPDGAVYERGAGTQQLPSGTFDAEGRFTLRNGVPIALTNDEESEGTTLPQTLAKQPIGTRDIGRNVFTGAYRGARTFNGFRRCAFDITLSPIVNLAGRSNPQYARLDDTAFVYLGSSAPQVGCDFGLVYDGSSDNRWHMYGLVSAPALKKPLVSSTSFARGTRVRMTYFVHLGSSAQKTKNRMVFLKVTDTSGTGDSACIGALAYNHHDGGKIMMKRNQQLAQRTNAQERIQGYAKTGSYMLDFNWQNGRLWGANDTNGYRWQRANTQVAKSYPEPSVDSVVSATVLSAYDWETGVGVDLRPF